MGFNKRYLTEENVISVYERLGYDGLVDYITKPDALFTSSKKTSKIVEVITSDSCVTNKEMKIKNILYGMC